MLSFSDFILENEAVIKSFAEQSGKSTKEIEDLWDKAKKIAKEQNEDHNYAYITGILKNMIGIS